MLSMECMYIMWKQKYNYNYIIKECREYKTEST